MSLHSVLQTHQSVEVRESSSRLAFGTQGSGSWKIWNRYLTFEGERLRHLGNICGTCQFWFTRLGDLDASLSAASLSRQLADGITSLDDDLIAQITPLLPNGKYEVALLRVVPVPVEPASPSDYFAHEAAENGDWGGGDEPPHDPKGHYYRAPGPPLADRNALSFQFIVPLVSECNLDRDRLSDYDTVLSRGGVPTALALSVLDVKQPYDGDPHWCAAHYLLDGHHKVAAAAASGSEVGLLAFFAVDHGISSPDDVVTFLGGYSRP